VEDEGQISGAHWDSIHVVEVDPSEDGSLLLCLTSTIILAIKADFPLIDAFRLGGSLTRQTESTLPSSAPDNVQIVAAVGRLVEDAESKMRSALQEIYFGKTHDIINELRPALPEGYLRNQDSFKQDLQNRISAHGRAAA